jgi:DNA-binding MarR family transcriptional regulator
VLEQWRHAAPGVDRSAFAVVGRISRLARLLEPELEGVFAEHGINAGEFDVLAALRRAEPHHMLTPTQLSRALIVTSGGMTKRLIALEGRGLIRRRPDRDDGRSTTVSLTAEGKRLVDVILPAHSANESRLIGELGAGDRAQLARLLEALAIGLGDEPH